MAAARALSFGSETLWVTIISIFSTYLLYSRTRIYQLYSTAQLFPVGLFFFLSPGVTSMKTRGTCFFVSVWSHARDPNRQVAKKTLSVTCARTSWWYSRRRSRIGTQNRCSTDVTQMSEKLGGALDT